MLNGRVPQQGVTKRKETTVRAQKRFWHIVRKLMYIFTVIWFISPLSHLGRRIVLTLRQQILAHQGALSSTNAEACRMQLTAKLQPSPWSLPGASAWFDSLSIASVPDAVATEAEPRTLSLASSVCSYLQLP